MLLVEIRWPCLWSFKPPSHPRLSNSDTSVRALCLLYAVFTRRSWLSINSWKAQVFWRSPSSLKKSLYFNSIFNFLVTVIVHSVDSLPDTPPLPIRNKLMELISCLLLQSVVFVGFMLQSFLPYIDVKHTCVSFLICQWVITC